LPVILSYLREKSTANPKKSDIFVEMVINMIIKRYVIVFVVFIKKYDDILSDIYCRK
jgi:hypothetical protein